MGIVGTTDLALEVVFAMDIVEMTAEDIVAEDKLVKLAEELENLDKVVEVDLAEECSLDMEVRPEVADRKEQDELVGQQNILAYSKQVQREVNLLEQRKVRQMIQISELPN